MVDMQSTANVGYTNGIKQSFKQKIAYMAAENGQDVSIFMNAIEQGPMRTTMEDLLNEANGVLPDNYDCKSFAEKLTGFVKGLFAFNNNEQQDNNFSTDKNKEAEESNFSFETKTDLE